MSRRRIFLAAPLALSGAWAGVAATPAAEWRVADVAATGFTFIDVRAVERKGDQVTFSTWTVKTSKAANGIDNWKVVSVADCAKHSYRDVRIDYFAGAGFVERSDPEPEREALPDTMAFSKIAVACGDQAPSAEPVADPYELVQEHVRRSMEDADAAAADPDGTV